ncbi:MAG: hypothetical protein GXO32_01730 [Crenarchaeota archaeon]|nr:hypothetical protein [Thermoproteota archaeon]
MRNEYDKVGEYLSKVIDVYRFLAAPRDLLIQLDLPLLPDMDRATRARLQQMNVELYWRMRREFGTQLVLVLHGWSREDWDKQLECVQSARVVAVGSFFGMIAPPAIARSARASTLDPKLVAERLVEVTRFLHRHASARLMLLGAGSPKDIYVAAALGYDYADSSSWRVAATLGEIYDPETLDRLKVVELARSCVLREKMRRAYEVIEGELGVPWSFDEWLGMAVLRSVEGYVARAWFNAMITKLVEREVRDASWREIVAKMLWLYERSPRWSVVAKMVARYAGHQGFGRALPKLRF